MKIFLLILCSLYITSSYSQILPQSPYQKLQFKNFSPKWYEAYKDESVDLPGVDGYNQFGDNQLVPPLIDNNFIYTISQGLYLGSQAGNHNGYYISCHDLNTGKLIWQNRYSVYDGEMYVELPRYMSIIDGNLEIGGQKNMKPYMATYNLFNLVLFRKILNKKDGSLIRIYNPTPTDTTAFQSAYIKIGLNAPGIFMRQSNNNFTIINVFNSNQKIGGFTLARIDSLGYLLKPHDTIYNKYNVINPMLSLVGQDSLLYCETKVIGQDSYLVLRYFDTSGDQLKELDEKQILMNVNYYYFKLYGVLQNQGKLIFSVFNPPNDDFPSFYYQYIKINFKGDILSTIDLNNLNTTLIKDWYSEDENIYGIELIQDDENNIPLKTGLSFVRYYGSFQRDILKTYEFKDSTRLGYPYLFIDIPNTNDVISIWSEAALHINQSGSLSYDNGAFTKSIMRTDKSIFEFPISNAIEIDSDENELLIYPNPVDDILYIQCRVDKYNLKITNINGQTIKVCDDCSWIEMSDVLPGSYFIQITTDEGKVNSILFIKI